MKIKTMLVAALACACVFANEKPKSLKVLMIGNSFSICLLQEMPGVAKSMGLNLDLCSLYIGGCSLERHWQNVCKPETAPYQLDWNYGGVKEAPDAAVARIAKKSERTHWKTKKVETFTACNIPEALTADKWDVVTVQQASHYSWQPPTYHPFGDDLVKKIHELAPQARVVVQETWSYTPWDKRLSSWKMDQNEMYAKLHDAYYAFAKQQGCEVIPVGAAVQAWRRELPVKYTENSFGGDVVGSAKFVQENGAWVPKGDVFHFNGDGHYLQALVWTAKLFGVDVTQCPYAPAKMPAEKAALMKKVAQQSVK